MARCKCTQYKLDLDYEVLEVAGICHSVDFCGGKHSFEAHRLTTQLTTAKKRIETLEKRLNKLDRLTGMSTPWPIQSRLQKLCESADILLDDKSYDGHGWELIHEAREQARARIAVLEVEEGK